MGVKQLSAGKRNLLHMEILRVLAIWFVMFNHTEEKGFLLYIAEWQSPFSGFYLFFSIFDKIAVPVFFMISGALLLGKEESIKTLYRKRILRFVLILAAISMLYHVYNWWFNGTELTVWGAAYTLYGVGASVALWYLYSYISLLVMLPILRRLVQGLKVREYLYWIAAHIFLVGVLPIVEYLFSSLSLVQKSLALQGGVISVNYAFDPVLLTATNIFYFVTGYFFENVLPDSWYTRRKVVIGGALSFLAILASCGMIFYEYKIRGGWREDGFTSFYSVLIAIPAFTVYIAAKYFVSAVKIPLFAQKIISVCGSCTFCVYLLEAVLREQTEILFFAAKPYIGTFLACCLWITVALLAGIIVSLGLKKLPIVGKFL